MPLTFSDYQKKAFTTAIYPDKGEGSRLSLAYVCLGLGGESGEVQEKIKKFLRGDHGEEITPEFKKMIALEISDVLWYTAGICTELGLDLGDVAQMNLDKLFKRRDEGKLKGSGDTR